MFASGTKALRAIALVAVIFGVGCSETAPPFPPASRVEIIDFRSPGLSKQVVDDPVVVAQIVAMLNSFRDGWTRPYTTLPVPIASVVVYEPSGNKRSFDLIPIATFAIATSDGSRVRTASTSEVMGFLDVIGLDPDRFEQLGQ